MSGRNLSALSLLAVLALALSAAPAAFAAGPTHGAAAGVSAEEPTAAARQAAPDTATSPPPEWQQQVSYRIEARLAEKNERVRAAATFRYRNASPDTLDRLYFHLYLNAFRPNSEWARSEQRERLQGYRTMEDPDYGYERVRSVRMLSGPGARGSGGGEGTALTPSYPHAPDSTVMRLDLPGPLHPGDSLTLRLAWDARPSTLCRRQCRQGRQWDLAQWYPRIAVYDGGGWQEHPLYPQGEFYGEFATYDVTLDLRSDQVVGATGVPVEGDPGWEPAPGSPADEPLYQRDFYGEDPTTGLPDPGLLPESAGGNRRRVRFHAEDVHHFAWSANPEYRYEGTTWERGDLDDVAVHVLYRPGDTAWDDGVAVERSVRALSWLQTIYRPYPYPQFTNLHRIEGGGTEFPMLVMDGGVSQGLIVHEAAHQYTHGILANNEWKEAWLDEGIVSFTDGWYAEEHGGGNWARSLESTGMVERVLANRHRLDSVPGFLRGMTVQGSDTLPTPRPVATRSEHFANYGQYGYGSYTKPSVVFYMFREMVGKETMRRILRTYYDRYEFRHVNEGALRSVVNDVTGRDYGWFWDQWLHTTDVLDYRVAEVSAERLGPESWRTTVEVTREGGIWMPVTVQVGDARRRLTDRFRSRTVTLTTERRPKRAVVDPDEVLLDVDRSNNAREIPR
ncbi:MAG: M1 family metallopeptidase [Candidatus Palauibacterales bacterium]|nr:M1 family metallopeptidase [Candidatus Palauibacterales bacterium]